MPENKRDLKQDFECLRSKTERPGQQSDEGSDRGSQAAINFTGCYEIKSRSLSMQSLVKSFNQIQNRQAAG